MTRPWGTALAVLTLTASSLWAAPPPGITLIGKGLVSGAALDKSGLTGNICQAPGATTPVPPPCVPKALLGGFGSALTYTGHNNVYVAAPDRGPFDGLTDVPYLDRVHFLHITTDLNTQSIQTTLLDTRLLKNELGQTFVGAAGAFQKNKELATLRFDPEGIRVGLFGTLFISDEYGPFVFEFGSNGQLFRRLDVPSKFLINKPNADATLELLDNKSGRQANRGMEGLAISPNDRFLVGIMQSALLQDHGLNPGTTDRLGLNNRILKIDLLTGKKREYVYVLDAINRGQGVSEILAINDHEFLVVERDNRSNLPPSTPGPTRKTIYKIDIAGATDVSDIDELPAGTSTDPLPGNIMPVKKDLFIDLLEPAFNLAPTIAEKIESLAWGPDLPDGKHVLYVASDNDLNPNLDTQIYSFAIDAAILNFEKQFQPIPIYPPWLIP